MKKLCGIYCIKNIVNGKMYIGQSVDIFRRWCTHIRELNKNTHYSEYLQHSWNKYGITAFVFKILIVCKLEDLNDYEIYYIEHFDTLIPNGYNGTKGGNNISDKLILKAKHKSDLTIKKSKESLKKHFRTHVAHNSIKVILLNTLEIFPNSFAAAKKYNCDPSSIHKCCKHLTNYCGIHNNNKLIWLYYDEYLNLSLDDIQNMLSKSFNKVAYNKTKVMCITTGEIFDSQTSAAIKYNMSPSTINGHLKGRSKYAGCHNGVPLIWKYIE